MIENQAPARLALIVSSLVRRGDRIEASVDASNLPSTVVTLVAPDTVVISQPHTQAVGAGTFQRTISWNVVHVPAGL